jgi:hypothetical protein
MTLRALIVLFSALTGALAGCAIGWKEAGIEGAIGGLPAGFILCLACAAVSIDLADYFAFENRRNRKGLRLQTKFVRHKFGDLFSTDMMTRWERIKERLLPGVPLAGIVAAKCGTVVFVDAGLPFPVSFETRDSTATVPTNGQPVSGIVICCHDKTHSIQMKPA